MSQTKVKIPELSPIEYHILVEAVKFYYNHAKSEAIDSKIDIQSRNIARGNATLSKDLLEKIG